MTSFGPFVLAGGALLRDGKSIALGQRALALLEALAAAEGPVDKTALIGAAWPGAIVEEGNLTVQIAALRKALGTRPDGSEWIVTVPRVGYRLVRGEGARPEVQVSDFPVLAVLPFQNLGGDPDQDYFADGMVDDLITALSRFKNFAVIARNSSFAYKGNVVDVRKAASELGVRYVLEGSVRRAGSRLRIGVRLVDGASGAQIWAEHYDGELDEIFDFQDRIVESIVGIVEPQLQQAEIERARSRRPDSLTGYDLYLRALEGYGSATEPDNVRSTGLIERAIEVDPQNGTYLIIAADVIQHRFGMGWPPLRPDDARRARDLINRALAAAPDDPNVVTRAGNMLLQHFREYDRGLAMVRRGVALNPFNFFSVGLAGVGELHCGDLDVAQAHFERAARLNPGRTGAYFPLVGLAHVEMARENFDEALAWAERSYALNAEYDCCLWMLASANGHLGRVDAARYFCAELRRLSPRSTISSIRAGQPAKIPQRIEPVLSGLRLAGLPE
jgi:TolB-like protein/Tfp pilus assembly protein PilF